MQQYYWYIILLGVMKDLVSNWSVLILIIIVRARSSILLIICLSNVLLAPTIILHTLAMDHLSALYGWQNEMSKLTLFKTNWTKNDLTLTWTSTCKK